MNCPKTAAKEGVTATAAVDDVERLLDEWAMAWSSHEQNDPERALALCADDRVLEAINLGVIARPGNAASRRCVTDAGVAGPDLTSGPCRLKHAV